MYHICVSIYQLTNIWVVLTFWLLWIMLLWTFVCKSLCACMFSFLLGIYFWVEWLVYCDDHTFTFWETAKLFSKSSCLVLYFNQQYISLHHHQQFLLFYFFYYTSGISLWFWFTFAWWLMMLSIFSCAHYHLCFSLKKCLFKTFAHSWEFPGGPVVKTLCF